MQNTIKLFVASVIGSGLLLSSAGVHDAQARTYSESKRFHQCKQLRSNGQLSWYGIASGTVNDGSGPSGFAGFHIKTCHSSRKSCDRWVRNIYREIPRLDEVRTVYCQAVYRTKRR